MKRRLMVLAPLCVGLSGCASPHGVGYRRLVPESRSFTPRFVVVFNSESFSAGVAKELAYVRTADFARRFSATYSAVLSHNGITAEVAVEPAGSQTFDSAVLLAEVTGIDLYHNRVNGLKWQWSLFNPEGVLVSRWESAALWEGYSVWGGGPNERHVEACIQNLALLALNTLQTNGHVTLSRAPAETPSGLRKALL